MKIIIFILTSLLFMVSCTTKKSVWKAPITIKNQGYFLINNRLVPEKELETKNNFKLP